ncbi:MAG: gamma-glutamyl-gamma-aminobutyrate hydrolase family protein [Chloroflexi bacterium]|nr:gamma-glutamyl-gamma-aminobutyrate hydrolase family protein [Chloroflexota bacterium]
MDTSLRPIIGVTGHRTETSSGVTMVTAKEAYLTAVALAGGIPVVLPPVDDLHAVAAALDRVDGVLLTGGKDIDPAHYGQPILHDSVALEPDRDRFELPLTREAVARDVPVLAICRGCQVLNVALGGSLWQDLPFQRPNGLLHQQRAPRDAVTHPVTVHAGTALAAILGEHAARPFDTNSFHHQAVQRISAALAPAAHTQDDIVEAIEAPDRRFVMGIQWHPEDLVTRRPEHRRLFEAFVAAARRMKNER